MTKIPDQDIKDNSAFYGSARRLVQAIKQYYQRRHGVQISQKDLEKEAIRLIRSQS